MENLLFKETDETPLLDFNTNGNLLVKGISIPENINKFYTPVIDWLNNYKLTNPQNVTLSFQIEYINTSSTRVFIDIIKAVQLLTEQGCTVSINWLHDAEDEDNVELGEELEYSSKTKFIFKAV